MEVNKKNKIDLHSFQIYLRAKCRMRLDNEISSDDFWVSSRISGM